MAQIKCSCCVIKEKICDKSEQISAKLKIVMIYSDTATRPADLLFNRSDMYYTEQLINMLQKTAVMGIETLILVSEVKPLRLPATEATGCNHSEAKQSLKKLKKMHKRLEVISKNMTKLAAQTIALFSPKPGTSWGTRGTDRISEIVRITQASLMGRQSEEDLSQQQQQ
ncbi:uncharacterized protein LOC125957169 [Anopheles darlingi]|uniref:uncharacterized protein LOC125957169 n=1 Tax=Anopheles darlingi TaxID=43151 RepID=UPI0021001542|nr:uncharacterized protein LOC125957169 [Anopheles darlingi]